MRSWLWAVMPLVLFSCAHTAPPRSGVPGASSGVVARSCRPLSAEERNRILEVADPSNFPRTRYQAGGGRIDKATDCSRFVHEVYRRAGLPYAYRSTKDLGNAREFDLLPEKDARPGDLMLFKGHVGIVDEKGKIISALKTRHRRRKSSIEAIDRKYFKTFHGQRYVLRYRCGGDEQARNLASEKKQK